MLATVVAIVVCALGWRLGHGPQGVAYLGLMLLSCVPGLPLGTALFGRRPAGWITGAGLGYAITCVTLALVIAAGATHPAALLGAFVVVNALTWTAAWGRGPFLEFRPWTRGDVRALCLVLLLVPAIVGPPFDSNGARDTYGNRYFRAYFTADFMWHMALTKELARLQLPPHNPYQARTKLQYYWTYFVVPAVVASQVPRAVLNTESVLELNALGTGLLFVATLFAMTRVAVPSGLAAAMGVATVLVAASAEGAYVLWRVYRDGTPLDWVRNVNVDAVTLWMFSGLTIDGLPRALWYTPQHAFACTLALPAFAVASRSGGVVPSAAAGLAGLSLAGAVVLSPFLGATFALVYGLVAIVASAQAGRSGLAGLPRLAITATPVLVAAIACSYAQMINSGGQALTVGTAVLAQNAPVLTLLLSLGPVLLPAAIGLLALRRVPPVLWSSVVMILVGLALFFFVSLGHTDPIWVGWRAGQVVLVGLPPLVGFFFLLCRRRWGRVGVALAATLVFLAGSPTTIIDTYNAQDTSNTGDTPYYRWTVQFTTEQQAAFEWIAKATPRDALVQMEPISRRRDLWSVIPSLAGRRMAGGLPIWLLDMPEAEAEAEQISEIFRSGDATQAWELAGRKGIDYIYVDRFDRESLPSEALVKFGAAPELFTLVFRNRDVSVYRVVREGA